MQCMLQQGMLLFFVFLFVFESTWNW